jgi:hypothetical protein
MAAVVDPTKLGFHFPFLHMAGVIDFIENGSPDTDRQVFTLNLDEPTFKATTFVFEICKPSGGKVTLLRIKKEKAGDLVFDVTFCKDSASSVAGHLLCKYNRIKGKTLEQEPTWVYCSESSSALKKTKAGQEKPRPFFKKARHT